MFPILARHFTQVIFWGCCLSSLFAILLSVSGFLGWWAATPYVVLAASMAFKVWAIRRSEREGFVKSREMRRAFEPARHFNGAQVFTLVVLIILEIGVATFLLVQRHGPGA